MSRLRVAVIGVGHLGKEHARILAGMKEVELVGVADVNHEQAQAVARRCQTRAYSEYWPLLNLVDAATVVAPTVYHHDIAAEFLRRGISLLVEKPITTNLQDADQLVSLAHKHGAVLQVGHIERFNPAYEELRRRPMQPKFIECERLSGFSGRSTDIGVVLDVMIHDLDLLLDLVGAPVQRVEAIGITLFGKHEDAVNARLTFANGCVANVTASRASPVQVRQMRVWSPEGYAAVDFAKRGLTLIQPSEGLRRQDPAVLAMIKSEMFGRHLEVVHLDRNQGDQLTRELKHFTDCVQARENPRCSGVEGRNALALAEQILDSVRNHEWEGRTEGPTGPMHLPQPLGRLFQLSEGEAAA